MPSALDVNVRTVWYSCEGLNVPYIAVQSGAVVPIVLWGGTVGVLNEARLLEAARASSRGSCRPPPLGIKMTTHTGEQDRPVDCVTPDRLIPVYYLVQQAVLSYRCP